MGQKNTRIRALLLALGAMLPMELAATEPSMHEHYESGCSREDNIQKSAIENSGAIDAVLNHVNASYHLPEPITLKLICASDDDPGPYYDPETREVVIPYTFRKYVLENLKRQQYSEDVEELNIVADDVVLHTIYHEIGHALVDILNLPITGKEEDAVDELSTLLLLATYEDGDEVAISAGEFFGIESFGEEEVSEEQLYGIHSLDQQRFFNILCLVYGENPDARADLFDGLDIDEERADICIEDFERRQAAWDELLEPYSKR